MIGSSFCEGVGHIEGRPSMIGLGGVRAPKMRLRGGIKLQRPLRIMTRGREMLHNCELQE